MIDKLNLIRVAGAFRSESWSHRPWGCWQYQRGFGGSLEWRPFKSSLLTHHSWCTSITSCWFVSNDSSFILGLLCYGWLSFCSMSPLCIGSLPDFCWLFVFVFSLGCVYLCSHFALYFCSMGPSAKNLGKVIIHLTP